MRIPSCHKKLLKQLKPQIDKIKKENNIPSYQMFIIKYNIGYTTRKNDGISKYYLYNGLQDGFERFFELKISKDKNIFQKMNVNQRCFAMNLINDNTKILKNIDNKYCLFKRQNLIYNKIYISYKDPYYFIENINDIYKYIEFNWNYIELLNKKKIYITYRKNYVK